MPARLHPIFILAGAFLLLSPLSVATGLSFSEPAKYLRLGTTVVMLLVWLGSRRGFRLGGAAQAFVTFGVVFTASAAWSDLPHWALFYKGMFLLTSLAGLSLAGTVRSADELRKGMRFLGMVSAAAAVLAFAVYRINPDEATTQDRMAVLGINANMLGQTAAVLLILCAHLALNEPSRTWKRLMLFSGALLAVIIIGTGSRGALLMAGLGIVVLAIPHVARPGVLVSALVPAAIVGYLALEVIDAVGTERLVGEIGKNTRAGIWRFGLRQFGTSPIIGIGWLHWGERWGSVQSAYLQVLIESGLIGGAVLAGTLAAVLSRAWRTHAQLQRQRLPADLSYLMLACLISTTVHGLAESSMVMGSTLNPLLLGLGVGLGDRVREFSLMQRTTAAHRTAWARSRREAWAARWRRSPGGSAPVSADAPCHVSVREAVQPRAGSCPTD